MSKHSGSNLRVPEKVIKNIFDLINQLREEYQLPPLHFSKDLSFLAGEHACNMSTKKTPYGHTGFDERRSQVPAALMFSENIAVLSESNDPGQDIVVCWLSRPSSFSRILSTFTHTGIGVAESGDGGWYCCQIFATIKPKLTRKEALLLVARFANRQRSRHDLPPLATSLIATGKMLKFCKEHPDNVLSLTQQVVKTFFAHCHEAEYVIETLPSSTENLVLAFIAKVKEHGNGIRTIRKEFNEIGFVAQRVPDGQTICVIALAKCGNIYGRIPQLHIHYPDAFRFAQLLNDYRAAHQILPLRLSHRWSAAAHAAAEKMAAKEIPVIGAPVAKAIAKKCPGSTIVCGAACVPQSGDVCRDIMAVWAANFRSRAELLATATDCGFGYALCPSKTLCAVRLIGNFQNPQNLQKSRNSQNPQNIDFGNPENPEANQYPLLITALEKLPLKSRRPNPNLPPSQKKAGQGGEGPKTVVTGEVQIGKEESHMLSEYFCLTSEGEEKEGEENARDAELSFKLAS